MFITFIIVSLLTGYLLGSINPSILVSKHKGEDIRTKGSGNAGMTNTLRTYGKGAAVIVLVCDILKAAVAILLAAFFANITGLTEHVRLFEILSATGCILGHNYPLYFGFKGGKGVLVSITAVMILNPTIGLLALGIFILVFGVTQYVSLGSILAALFVPVLAIVFKADTYFIVFSIFASLLTIWRHRTNIVRLINKNEKKTVLIKKK